MPLDFDETFKALTGNPPFPWQTALYERFKVGDIPKSCNLPTGLGKTSVIAVWLIALANKLDVPRRLVYVVNRRTVVDQTTEEVEKYRAPLAHRRAPVHPDLLDLADDLARLSRDPNAIPLAISTLRGQFADNREWSADPSRPAVICGTVDMIGSRLLFSGYGVGFKSKPLHAGFLGQDALLVHDEAHLEPAFQKLIEAIETEQKRCDDFMPMKVMELTATSRGVDQDAFPNKEKDPKAFEYHAMVEARITAKKKLYLLKGAHEDAIPTEIAKIAGGYKDDCVAVLVFASSIKAVEIIEREVRKTEREVLVLTGTMRGKERDEFVNQKGFHRFLKGGSPGETIYLICTSAGEVGIDMSAQHMVCDLSTFESIAQRLGRVHRYGEPAVHEAMIHVVHPSSFGKRDKKGELKASPMDVRRSRTLDLLRKLPTLGENCYDASPKALGALRERTDLPFKIDEYYAPPPQMVPATDILFDAWALTSITAKLPGRPEVAPYLHGIDDERSQTTVVWRNELNWIKEHPKPDRPLAKIFAKHRIRPHETLTTNTKRVIEFLTAVTKTDPRKNDVVVALVFTRGTKTMKVGELLQKEGLLYAAEPTVVLPDNFGGLNEIGMLDASAPATDESLDIADIEGYERQTDSEPRQRVRIQKKEAGWLVIDGEPDQKATKSTVLVKGLATGQLKVRLVQSLKFDTEGEDEESLVCLSPVPELEKPKPQSLAAHVAAVETEAKRIANALELKEPFHSALILAAKWHDEGKNADIWQRYIGGPMPDGSAKGKSAEWCNAKKLAGYRHEFGSLLYLVRDHPDAFADHPDAKELALHMIASHHGFARPHFLHAILSGYPGERVHGEVIRRYASLQRLQGHGRWGLAYLESLLRAADIAASKQVGNDPELDDDAEEGEE